MRKHNEETFAEIRKINFVCLKDSEFISRSTIMVYVYVCVFKSRKII